eukprot:3190726-Rhodomonas_salina.1
MHSARLPARVVLCRFERHAHTVSVAGSFHGVWGGWVRGGRRECRCRFQTELLARAVGDAVIIVIRSGLDSDMEV